MLVGASPYLYVVLRARQRPSHCEACPYTWSRFVDYVLQPRFGGTLFAFSPAERLPHVGDLLWQQFFGWGIVLVSGSNKVFFQFVHKLVVEVGNMINGLGQFEKMGQPVFPQKIYGTEDFFVGGKQDVVKSPGLFVKVL